MVYRICFKFRKAAPGREELLTDLLAGLGIDRRQIIQETQKGKTGLAFFLKEASRATSFKRRFLASGVRGVAIRVQRLADKDWLTKWKRYFRPFNFTRRLRLIPYGQKDKHSQKGREPIFIDTATAFGSGLHPTTQLVAGLIEDKRGAFRSFLDIGTGSGILSVVAAKSGASRIEAIDCDRQVIATARRNFELNGVQGAKLKFREIARFRPGKKFDFVSANLITEDLLRENKAILNCVKPGGYLAVSGISQENLGRFRARFSGPRLKCLRIIGKKSWAAALYRRVK
jgi:ribosomal protein L11 methyltransferase